MANIYNINYRGSSIATAADDIKFYFPQSSTEEYINNKILLILLKITFTVYIKMNPHLSTSLNVTPRYDLVDIVNVFPIIFFTIKNSTNNIWGEFQLNI